MARTIVQTFEVFGISELEGVNYRNAIEATSRQAHEAWMEVEVFELVKSMELAAQNFGLRVTNYKVGLFDQAHVEIDSSLFDDEQAEHALEWIKEHHAKGRDGSCPFSGRNFDSYFFDHFGEEVTSTPDTILEDIEDAIVFMMERAIDSAETDIMDEAYLLDYIAEDGIEFTADGEIYNG